MKGEGTRERINRDVHPDDLERVQNERRAGLSGECRSRRKSGCSVKMASFAGFLFRYNPVLNEAGDIVRWFATGDRR